MSVPGVAVGVPGAAVGVGVAWAPWPRWPSKSALSPTSLGAVVLSHGSSEFGVVQ
ncbi:MAG: hypothetical protein U0802_16820 [Candidatus Binatia bacterium]